MIQSTLANPNTESGQASLGDGKESVKELLRNLSDEELDLLEDFLTQELANRLFVRGGSYVIHPLHKLMQRMEALIRE